jgi:hypothetical protein
MDTLFSNPLAKNMHVSVLQTFAGKNERQPK